MGPTFVFNSLPSRTMRKSLCLLILCIGLSLTGCPPQNEPAPTPKSEPAAPTAEKPATGESSAAAKAVETLVNGLGGKSTLTPSGTVKSIVIADGANLNADAMKLFGEQPDLETLQIRNFRDLNDAMVGQLTGLKKLKSLTLANAGITDKGIKTLVEAFPTLKELDIASNTLLTDASLKEIAKLQDLELLSINYCNFSEFGMMDISKLAKLKTLDLRANMQVGGTGMGFLAKLPSLKTFKHMSSAIDDMGLEALTAVTGLETLEIQDFNITEASGQIINRFQNLKNLIVFRCDGFGPQALQELKGMKLLRLTLRDLASINDEGLSVFRDMPTLKRLYLRELPSVSDDGVANLSSLKELELLSIWEVPITDKSLDTISKLDNVKELELRSTDITEASVEKLLSMPKLENLTITDNAKMSQTGLDKLRDSKKFKKLDTKPYVAKR